jgi:putative membrane protein
MMYGYGVGWGWMWFGGIVLVLILAALIVLIIRLFTWGASSAGAQAKPASRSSARQIAEERLARGEISPDEFGQIARALDEGT